MSKGEIIEVDFSCFLINLDNLKEVSYQPKESGNWKFIQSMGFGHPLTPSNNEIVYRLKTNPRRGYIHKTKQR
jgi:hypothetical protein